MRFDEMGKKDGKILMLLPGTCMNYETNFSKVLDALKEKYHLICVNYDGFDGTDTEFKDMIDVTEKIENYIKDNYNGKIDGALGSSLGSSFVGQLISVESSQPGCSQNWLFRFYPVLSAMKRKNSRPRRN